MRSPTMPAAFAVVIALVTTAAAAAGPATATPAAAKKPIVLSKAAQTEEVYTDAQGQQVRRYLALTADKAKPGDEVVFTITYSNSTAQPVVDVTINDPIAREVMYREGTASGPGADIEFSADGGKTFGKPSEVKVEDEDGKKRAAQPADYTHIRWRLLAPVAPGYKGVVRYRSTIR